MKRALISVFDKTGIVEFARELVNLNWEIISTGGTYKKLQEENIPVTEVTEITEFPECFDGRVKTLHPKIHGGILSLRDNKSHVEKMEELNIQAIDMVVCNLYPFKETLQKEGVSHEDIIENIDIGGPSMLRAAAKNYKFVTVITDPRNYGKILDELKTKDEITNKTKELLAAEVFRHTSLYDSLIADYFNKISDNKYPETISLTYQKKQDLRYGENPHQAAAFYSEIFETKGSLSEAQKLHGKELSFNNINDTNGALETIKEFDEPTVVAVKHANPCGIGSGNNIKEAYIKAYKADEISIFGGIIAANRTIDKETAELINKIFIEVIIAPSYSTEALELLQKKKNIRLLQLPTIKEKNYTTPTIRSVQGGLLVQERDNILLNEEMKCVTKRQATEEEMSDLIFAWKAVKHTKSNGIVLAKDNATVAVGPGQVSRIWALENCIKQAADKTVGSVLASDAFFPFSDSVETAAKAGITAIIQPGGSIKDKESIEAADKHNIAMIFTGIRHFKH